MNYVGCFSEMKLGVMDSGSVHNSVSENVTYDKQALIKRLKEHKHIASCPRAAIDCITGKKISQSFLVFRSEDFVWCDFLIYHIQNYNIELSEDFIKHIMQN